MPRTKKEKLSKMLLMVLPIGSLRSAYHGHMGLGLHWHAYSRPSSAFLAAELSWFTIIGQLATT